MAGAWVQVDVGYQLLRVGLSDSLTIGRGNSSTSCLTYEHPACETSNPAIKVSVNQGEPHPFEGGRWLGSGLMASGLP